MPSKVPEVERMIGMDRVQDKPRQVPGARQVPDATSLRRFQEEVLPTCRERRPPGLTCRRDSCGPHTPARPRQLLPFRRSLGDRHRAAHQRAALPADPSLIQEALGPRPPR